jgi:hypothetical protein
MNYPRITGFDCFTNEIIDREMTKEEYDAWLSEPKREMTHEAPISN